MGPMLRRGQSKVQNKQLKDQAAFPRVGRGRTGVCSSSIQPVPG